MDENQEKTKCDFQNYYPEKVFEYIRYKISKKEIKLVVIYFFCGFCVYMPMLTQWLTNPDGLLYSMIYRDDHGWENSQGRFGLYYFDKLKNDFIFPVAETLYCILLLAVIALLICKIFNCTNHLLIYIAVGAFVILSPNISNLLTYYYCSAAYMTSYLLAVIGAYLIIKRTGIKSCLLSMVCILISLSLYQAYIGVTITLCIFHLIVKVLLDENWGNGFLKYLVRGGITGAGGIIGYLFAFKGVQLIKGITPDTVRGFDSMGRIELSEIPDLIRNAYLAFLQYFFTNDIINNSWKGRGQVNLFCTCGVLVLIIVIIVNKRLFADIKRIIILCAAIFFIPLILCCITIIAPDASIYGETGMLMLPQMNLFYIFMLVIAERTMLSHKVTFLFKWITVIITLYLVSIFWIYTNIFQTCLKINLDKTYNVATRMVMRMEMEEENQTGMDLFVYGRMERGNFANINTSLFEVTKGSVVRYGLFWEERWSKQNCWTQFLQQYLGVYYTPCNNECSQYIMEENEFKEMPIFPENGSVKVIDGVMVVKLSEE